MKTLHPPMLTPLILIAVLSGCQTGNPEVRLVTQKAPRCAPTPSKEAQAALANLHDTIRREMASKPDASYETIFEDVSRIADRHANTYKAILHEEATRILCTSPSIPAPDPAVYKPAIPKDQMDLDEISRALETEGGNMFGAYSGISLFTAWNPLRIAYMTRSAIIGRAFAPEEMARSSILDSLAPLRPHTIDPNPEAPIVALVGGGEIFVVHMRFIADRGIYLPTRVGWWKRP